MECSHYYELDFMKQKILQSQFFFFPSPYKQIKPGEIET